MEVGSTRGPEHDLQSMGAPDSITAEAVTHTHTHAPAVLFVAGTMTEHTLSTIRTCACKTDMHYDSCVLPGCHTHTRVATEARRVCICVCMCVPTQHRI